MTKRVTALLGAGATIEVGGPTSGFITMRVRDRWQELYDPTTNIMRLEPFLERVTAELERLLHPEPVNFEQVFHALEMLSSFSRGLNPGTAAPYKPLTGAFLKAIDPAWLDQDLLLRAKQDLVDEVYRVLVASMYRFDPHVAHRWFSDFWRAAITECPWDIGTLNYDDVVERSIGAGAYEDGYSATGAGFDRFSSRSLRAAATTRILHLHGSVYYGYPRLGNTYIFEDHWEDLYRFYDPLSARQTWFNRSTFNSQSHEETTAGPIITGLRKADKGLFEPYDAYHAAFRTAVEDSPHLLVAGYSFGDLHFNNIIDRMYKLHGGDRRVVVIACFPGGPANWHPDPAMSGWATHEMIEFLSKAARDFRPMGNSLLFRSPLVSSDGCCRIYLLGMKDALVNHGADIIRFLCS